MNYFEYAPETSTLYNTGVMRGIFVLGNVLYKFVGSVYCTVKVSDVPWYFRGGQLIETQIAAIKTKAIATSSRDWNLHKSQVP